MYVRAKERLFKITYSYIQITHANAHVLATNYIAIYTLIKQSDITTNSKTYIKLLVQNIATDITFM